MGVSTAEYRVRPDKHIPGEAGVWVFLFGDLGIFVIFFVSYLVERAGEPGLYTESSGELGLAVGVVNTLVLLASSLAVVAGVSQVRRGQDRAAVGAFAGAMFCGVLFVALKAFEYTHLAAGGHGPDSNPFFTWYFILTGVHLLHVLIALGVLALVISKVRGSGDRQRRLMVIESGTCYWHLVDLLWMLIFPLLYLVA